MANNVSFIIQLKDKFSRAAEQFNRTFDGMDRRADSLNRKLEDFSKRGKQIREFSGKVATAGAVMTAGFTAPAILLSKHMVGLASDADETANKFNEVFKGIGPQATAAVSELTSGFNLAQSSAQELLSDTGDLLVGLGLNRAEALKMSADIVKLSADVASFKNVEDGTARASSALTKALLGEREMLKETFKTAVREDEVTQRATLIRMKNRKLTEQQAKAMATLAIVTERNKDAIGDLARTSDSYANVSRKNDEAVKSLAESFGRLLIPLATKLLRGVTSLANWVNELSPGMKQVVLILGGLLAIGGPLLLVVAGLATAFSFMSLPVIAVSAAVLGLIAVGVLLVAKWDDITASLTEAWGHLQDMAGEVAASVSEAFSGAWASIKEGAIAAINFSIKALNNLLAPLNLAREALGMSAIAIPTVAAPTAPTGAATGTINGAITVSAAPGSRVESTRMTTAGSGLNMGVNMALAGP